MILGWSRVREATTLGLVLMLAPAIGCGSSSDSSGAGGISSTANSGGATSGGSGNSVAGSANGQAGATGGTDSDDGSGQEGGAGNDDTPEGGSGGRGDDNSSGGTAEGGGPGGEEGGAGGNPSGGSNPEAWTQCVNQDDCVLTPMTCCGQCGAVTPDDAAAVNMQYLSEFREAACGGPGICPACAGENDPRVSTYCSEQGQCVVDLALD
ncbi:MAG TPA: hypothetical protein VHO25_03135 [Polyangiaceae bacterium]|nr:hypothetical protein [Polyangiaceae bacterium]